MTASTGALERGYVSHSRLVDAMLAGTVLLWALNITVTKYLISHGWSPLAYGTTRYFLAIVTVLGVACVALSSGHVDSNPRGVLLALALPLTWSAYSIVIAPMMRRYSPFRISTLVLATGWLPLAVLSAHQVATQDFNFGWLPWLGFAYAVIGPLFLTNVLWFTAIDRVGPSRAALFANFEPFLAVLFAVLLLSDRLYAIEILGAVLILGGIVLERVWHQSTASAMSALD